MKTELAIGLIILFLGIGIFSGLFIGDKGTDALDDLQYNYCSYANNLTDIINHQSTLIEDYTSLSNKTLTKIRKLDCRNIYK